MISSVSGILTNKVSNGPRGAYFEVNLHGLGMEVMSSQRSVESATTVGETVMLYTAMIVREDSMSLVGFNSREERDLFNILNSASGVGPKVALALLSALSVSEIAQAVVSEQHKILTVAKGVGPKLAQKMTVDLKEKMTRWRQEDSHTAIQPATRTDNEAFREAEAVLLSLGYSLGEVSKSFTGIETDLGIDPEKTSSEEILQSSLRWLATFV